MSGAVHRPRYLAGLFHVELSLHADLTRLQTLPEATLHSTRHAGESLDFLDSATPAGSISRPDTNFERRE